MFWKQKSVEASCVEMVEKQLVKRGIKDERILAAMRALPRHKFVPEEEQRYAYRDQALPIGYGQTISQPYIVAVMTELLQIPTDEQVTVLEIGTGSGYQAAVLSRLVAQVYTVERIPQLAERAQAVYDELGLTNIHTKLADGGYGWTEHAPYDRIVTTAAAPDIPPPLLTQLAEGGILVAPIGTRHQQQLIRVQRRGDDFNQEALLPVAFVPFRGEHGWQEMGGL